MAIPKLKPLAEASEGTKKKVKPILIAVIAILLGAFGLEASSKDFDLGSLLSGNSISESEVVRDKEGNVAYDKEGNILTRILRDKEGNVAQKGQEGAKYTDEYNCDDFTTQPEAQKFFLNAGGARADTNNLDGDNDGEACEALPKGE